MEDDDEFGDLYTDVLTPFSDSSAFQPHQPPPRSEPAPPPIAAAAPTLTPDDAHILRAPSRSDSRSNLNINLNLNPTLNLNRSPPVQAHEKGFNFSEDPQLPTIRDSSANSPSGAPRVEAAQPRVLANLDFDPSNGVESADKGGGKRLDLYAAPNAADQDENWGLQAAQEDDGPVIPGISIAQPDEGVSNPNAVSQEEANNQGDDWESDSDDDLQIVLNDNGHSEIHQYQGPVGMGDNVGKGDDDDDEDEDGEPLVIVSDTDAVHHPPPPEEHGWGEDGGGQVPDGEGKEAGEKANGGLPLPPKTGYNNYGYHPYHSQFKYVRPGATPLPGGSGGPGQVRPPVNMSVAGGRGRGDWRPAGMKGSLQKNFQSGFWGSNASGRGFGCDFTLPSQKTIFDINIDSFEEKPWNHPGADITDYFNFGFNEDSWKEYCKKLEQLRMESTMKSKAHVLVVGSQQDQEYDPDLPPELAAAAAGIQDSPAENYNVQRADAGQSDVAKGNAVMRPPPPTGRPIQVETGSGERLPSVDTRPPRMRDPDTVIEIVLQCSMDDDAAEEDDERTGNEYSDGVPPSLDLPKEDNSRRFSRVSSSHDARPEDESSIPREAPIAHSSGSRENSPVYLSDKFESSPEERRMKEKEHERSRSTSPVQSALDGRYSDDKQEESNENMEGQDSPQGLSLEEKVLSDDEPSEIEGNDQKEIEDGNSNEITLVTSKHHSTKNLKQGSQVENMAAKEIDDLGFVKAARSSDNSRATASSQDHQKGNSVADEEGVQDEHSSHARDLKRSRREGLQTHHRKDRDGSLDTEKNNNMAKRRDLYSPHSSHVKSEGFDRRRERDYADGMLQQGGEDLHGRKYRAEDSRRHEYADGMIARHRGKVRESDRSSKDEYLPSRKVVENGNWRGHHEKDTGFRIKEKDDALKTRYENMDDSHRKRRKDDEHARRDHFEKDEILRAHRDNSLHRKREREESLDQRKRDDHRSVRSKDEIWLQRERVEQRHRERDDGFRSKQSYEEGLSRREREDGRAPIRSGRVAEDKGRTGPSRKDDYKGYERDGSYKDTGRNGELKRKERIDDGSGLHHGYEEKRSRQEKPTARSDRVVLGSDNQRVHERRPKENSRKPKQLEGGQQSTSISLKKPQEEKSGRNEMAGLIGKTDEDNTESGISAQEKTEESSDVADQHRSRRGRSKLERWGSHQERDGAGHSAKVTDDPAKKSQAVDVPNSASEGRESGVAKGNQHLDTVAKLKKRSERFKLPMPIEKDTTTIKKIESEPLSSAPSEAAVNSEMKAERPARKRRWISN